MPTSRWLWGQRARPGRRRRRGGFGDSGVLVVLVPPASADRLLVGIFQQLRDLPRKGLAHAMLARVYSSVDCSGFSPLLWIVLSFFVSCCQYMETQLIFVFRFYTQSLSFGFTASRFFFRVSRTKNANHCGDSLAPFPTTGSVVLGRRCRRRVPAPCAAGAGAGLLLSSPARRCPARA